MIARLIIIVAILAACRKPCPECPTIPVRGAGEPPRVVVAPNLPCHLPPEPQPFEIVGHASPEGIMVSKSDLAGLLVHLAGVRAWMQAAALCLEARK